MNSKMIKAVFSCLILTLSTFANASLIKNLDEYDGSDLRVTGTSDWSRGWAFDVNIDDAWITQFGFHTPEVNKLGYSIGLWNMSTETLLTSITASDTSNEWNWFNVPAFELMKGTRYLISLHGTGRSEYYYSTSSALKPSGDIDYEAMYYCNSCTDTEFPTNRLAGYNYGLVDFAYQIGKPQTPVSEPTTLAIFALALFGLASRRIKV